VSEKDDKLPPPPPAPPPLPPLPVSVPAPDSVEKPLPVPQQAPSQDSPEMKEILRVLKEASDSLKGAAPRLPPLPEMASSRSVQEPAQMPQHGPRVNPKELGEVPDIRNPVHTANAGNLHIEPGQGRQNLSFAGRAAVSLQKWSNIAADYGFHAPGLHDMGSWAKAASRMSGDTHTRGDALAERGIKGDTSGDMIGILRTISENTSHLRPERGPEAAQQQSQHYERGLDTDDLKDSIVALKESVDKLTDAMTQKTSPGTPGGLPGPRMSPPTGRPGARGHDPASPLGSAGAVTSAIRLATTFLSS
jgi:hypothetical protein